MVILMAFILTTAMVVRKESPVRYTFPELKFFPPMPVSAANPVTREGAALGRFLFYDTILSIDRNVSCASCHRLQYAFSDAPNAFTTGRNGQRTKRNTMPLFNLAWYPSLFWDGRAKTIEEQVFHPVRDTAEMGALWVDVVRRVSSSRFYKPKFEAAFGKQKIDSILIAKAIGQFLRTLVSYQSKFDRVMAGKEYLSSDELAGFDLMNDMTKGDCLHCHTTDADALGTTQVFSNNGLDTFTNALHYKDKGLGAVTGKVTDNGWFKVPSLRNVALTPPYMHDGRFATLEEVLDFYSTGVNACANIDSRMGSAYQRGVNLSGEEKAKIIAFLHTLTDSAFVTNKEFSNPFQP